MLKIETKNIILILKQKAEEKTRKNPTPQKTQIANNSKTKHAMKINLNNN